MIRSILAASVVFTVVGAAQADVISSLGDLTDGATQSGNFVSGADNFQSPATWRVYTFDANAGDNILVRVSRMAAQVDPIAFAHLGNLTGADVAPGILANDLSTYGLTFMASGDDSVDDAFGGPFGDPLFAFVAPATDTYTVITHMFGNYEGSLPYEVQVTGSTVPAPGAAALAAVGGLMCVRRRRR
jgi:hypothetical protein